MLSAVRGFTKHDAACCAVVPLGIAAVGNRETAQRDTCDGGKGLAALAEVAKIGIRQSGPANAGLRVRFVQLDEAIGISEGQRLHEHAIHDAEDHRVDADRERQADDGN